ncbi:MAG: serine hydrolase, partial [Acidobacteriota bacterium]
MRRGTAAFVLACLIAAPLVAGGPKSTLEKRLAEVIARFPGTMGISAKNLDTGDTVAVHGDVRFPTASLIKVAVMVEVYHQMAEGKFHRDTTVTLTDA